MCNDNFIAQDKLLLEVTVILDWLIIRILAKSHISAETIIFFVIDVPLCQTIHKIDLTFMVTVTVHQTYL